MKGANIIKITLIAVGVVIILAIIVAVISINNIMKNSKKGVAITTQKTTYKGGEDMNLKIKNYFAGRIYLSSCYPYYIEEEKNETWKTYEYIECPEENTAKYYLEANSLKAFQTIVPVLQKGLYRLSIPICADCQQEQKFIPQNWFYSNTFSID